MILGEYCYLDQEVIQKILELLQEVGGEIQQLEWRVEGGKRREKRKWGERKEGKENMGKEKEERKKAVMGE